MTPRPSASRTSSATEPARILSMTRARCTLTVFSTTPSSAAICLFSMPVTTRANTCRSRGVSVRARAWISSVRASVPRFRVSRSTARWMAPSRSLLANGLIRKSTAPAFMAVTLIATSPWPVMKTIGIRCRACASVVWRSIPVTPGMRTSRTTQQGPLPGVLDGHPDGLVASPPCPDHERAGMTVGLGHGLQAIKHHVQDHLLELDPVAADDRQARGEVHRHRHVPEDHVVPHELRHFADDVVDVERQVFERAPLEQNPQSLDDLRRTLVVGHDVVDDLAQLLEIRRVGLQVLLGDFRVVENRRQGLVELVRQRRRQLAHGRDAADVRQLLTEPSRLAP